MDEEIAKLSKQFDADCAVAGADAAENNGESDLAETNSVAALQRQLQQLQLVECPGPAEQPPVAVAVTVADGIDHKLLNKVLAILRSKALPAPSSGIHAHLVFQQRDPFFVDMMMKLMLRGCHLSLVTEKPTRWSLRHVLVEEDLALASNSHVNRYNRLARTVPYNDHQRILRTTTYIDLARVAGSSNEKSASDRAEQRPQSSAANINKVLPRLKSVNQRSSGQGSPQQQEKERELYQDFPEMANVGNTKQITYDVFSRLGLVEPDVFYTEAENLSKTEAPTASATFDTAPPSLEPGGEPEPDPPTARPALNYANYKPPSWRPKLEFSSEQERLAEELNWSQNAQDVQDNDVYRLTLQQALYGGSMAREQPVHGSEEYFRLAEDFALFGGPDFFNLPLNPFNLTTSTEEMDPQYSAGFGAATAAQQPQQGGSAASGNFVDAYNQAFPPLPKARRRKD